MVNWRCRISGGLGNDVLRGGDGNDVLYGQYDTPLQVTETLHWITQGQGTGLTESDFLL